MVGDILFHSRNKNRHKTPNVPILSADIDTPNEKEHNFLQYTFFVQVNVLITKSSFSVVTCIFQTLNSQKPTLHTHSWEKLRLQAQYHHNRDNEIQFKSNLNQISNNNIFLILF